MSYQRVRVTMDVLVKTKGDKPLASPHLVMLANRCRTYFWTAAFEGLDDRVEVVHDEGEKRHTHAHHHDARYERCRVCTSAATDELGPDE